MHFPYGPATLPQVFLQEKWKLFFVQNLYMIIHGGFFQTCQKLETQIIACPRGGKPLRTKNSALTHAAKRMGLRSIVLSEAACSQRASYNLRESTDRTFWKRWNYRTKSRSAAAGARVGRESDELLRRGSAFLRFLCDGGYTPPCISQHPWACIL